MKRRDIVLLSHLQNLVGQMEGAYHNDRSDDRAGVIIPLCHEAFAVLIAVLGQYDQITPRTGELEAALSHFRIKTRKAPEGEQGR
jgi:hypothetical protein